MNKGLLTGIIAVAVVVIIGGVWWIMSANNQAVAPITTQNNGTQNTSAAKGTLYMSFTDAAVNMGNISKVDMTVDKIYMHSQSQGWVTVSTNPQTFSLLALKASNSTQLMATAGLSVDTYDQAWFHISNVMVTETGKAAKQATLPSGDFKMQATVKVMENASSTATFDVLADKSLFKTSAGEFVFAPVVNFEGRENATATVGANSMVSISGGTVDSTTSAGMDINGEVKANFKLDLNSNLQINGGVISVKGAL